MSVSPTTSNKMPENLDQSSSKSAGTEETKSQLRQPQLLDESAAKSDPSLAAAVAAAQAGKYEKRKKFMHDGRVIYEWQQELEEVELFITPPPGVQAKHLDIKITSSHLKVGLKGAPPFIDEKLGGLVVESESFWTLEDGEIHITLQKSLAGQTWVGALAGHKALSESEVQQEQQKILLERFQREHPGFDFSNAKFSGAAPDARKFMGGFDKSQMQPPLS